MYGSVGEDEAEKKFISSPLVSTPVFNQRAFEEIDDEEETDGVCSPEFSSSSFFWNFFLTFLGWRRSGWGGNQKPRLRPQEGIC